MMKTGHDTIDALIETWWGDDWHAVPTVTFTVGRAHDLTADLNIAIVLEPKTALDEPAVRRRMLDVADIIVGSLETAAGLILAQVSIEVAGRASYALGVRPAMFYEARVRADVFGLGRA